MTNNAAQRYVRTERLVRAKRAGVASGEMEEMCLAREILEPGDFEVEAMLATRAYLDYRYKTPWARTQDFALAYQKWYAHHQLETRGEVGRRTQKHHLSMWPDRGITSLWRARQHADLLGMPYEWYVIAAMRSARDRGTTELPAPNQLYGAKVFADVERHLQEWQKANRFDVMPRDCDPHFLEENFQGCPVQLAALDAIEKDIRSRPGSQRPERIADYMHSRRVISEFEARRRLGDDLVDEANGTSPAARVRPKQQLDQSAPPRPGCFGLPHLSVDTMCASCPVADACAERAAAIDALLIDRHGTTEVRAARVREGNRKRKQRQRARQRSGASMTRQEHDRVLRELGNPKLEEKRLKAKQRRDESKPERSKQQPDRISANGFKDT